jgi:hypothetical protein
MGVYENPGLIMNDTGPPPSYTAASNDPPSYTFPTTFRIGTWTTKGPLVTAEQLKGHLSLLGAFSDLRSKIEALPSPGTAQDASSAERRWALYVALAVER